MDNDKFKQILDSREPITIELLREMTIKQLNEYTTLNNKRYARYSKPELHMLKVGRDEFDKINTNGLMIEKRHKELEGTVT